jgi:hypothetical protein
MHSAKRFKIMLRVLMYDMWGDTHINIAKPWKVLGLSVKYRQSCCWTDWFVLMAAGRVLSESAAYVATRKTAGTACTWQMPARWGVLFSEAWWSCGVDLAGSHLSLHSADYDYLLVHTFSSNNSLLLLLTVRDRSLRLCSPYIPRNGPRRGHLL